MTRPKKPATFWIDTGCTLQNGKDMPIATWIGLISLSDAKNRLEDWLATVKRCEFDGLPIAQGVPVNYAVICASEGKRARVVERITFSAQTDA